MRLAPMSVKAWLALIVGIALIPPLAFSVFLINRSNLSQEQVISTLATSTVAANADAIDRQVSGMLTTIRALSLSDSLRRGDLRAFHEEARKALDGTDTYAVLIDRQLQVTLNTRAPFGQLIGPVTDATPLRRAMETGKPYISDALRSRVAERWTFFAANPLGKDYGESAVLALSQNAEQLGSVLKMENLRGGWNAVIVDNKGIVLASTFMSSEVGKPFFLEAAMAERTSAQMDVRRDGKAYMVLSDRSELTGWTVNLWADAATVRRPIHRTYRLLMLGGLGLLAVSLLAAWLFGRQISRSVRRIAEDAHRLGGGQDVKAREFPVEELTTVSTALAEAATTRRAAESEIRFLMREVAHRSKNQLMVVSSLAKQSAAGAADLDEFSEAFGQRIMGLARSTDLLIAGSVGGVELGELVNAQVGPFRPGHEMAMTVEGPEFRISSQAAQTLGLAIHELATNAAKYGALSVQGGALSVTWSIDDSQLKFRWKETLPHTIAQPTRKGFGTRLIMRTLSGALGAQIDVRFEPNGAAYDIDMPIARLVEGAVSDSADTTRMRDAAK